MLKFVNFISHQSTSDVNFSSHESLVITTKYWIKLAESHFSEVISLW